MMKLKTATNWRERTNRETQLRLISRAIDDRKWNAISPELKDKIETLHERLTRLNHTEMRIIKLYHYEGKTFREIVPILGCPERTLYRRYWKAIEKLGEE